MKIHAHHHGADHRRSKRLKSAAHLVLSTPKVAGAKRLATGVVVIPEAAEGRKVSRAEMAQAVAALKLLPAKDLALIAKHKIHIHLYPVSGLEDGLLGATTIVQEDSATWRPTTIRIAVRSG